jgi:O2-independent ubiquinone biosynthesis protein UbiV
MAAGNNPDLTLGPLLFHWGADAWRDFYFRIADEADVGCVYLGEVVCEKRIGAVAKRFDAVRERLVAGGKEVVLSTLALIMSDDDLAAVKAMTGEADLLVEANDVAACALMAGRPHAIGPYVNIYNEGTLAAFAGRGATRVCLPPELPAESLEILAADAPAELEVQVFGRFPLALSARCYAARARGLAKENCGFVCREDGDGLAVDTLDGDLFLAANGLQTLSGACGNLIAELGSLRDIGLSRFRLSPQSADMVAIARIFRDVLDGRMEAEAADRRLAELVPDMPFANGFYHGAEGAAFLDSF